MTDEQKAALRALAEKATPGWGAAQIAVGHNPHHAALVSSYIAATHPAAVLALLDEAARLRAGLTKAMQYENKCDQTGEPCRETSKCGCYLEAENWCNVDTNNGDLK